MGLGQQDGKLRVHYSDRPVALLREVRQLAALGFSVPAKIHTTANTAQKFYRHGVVLKQVRCVCVCVCVCVYTVNREIFVVKIFRGCCKKRKFNS